jgi:hypothetical protein
MSRLNSGCWARLKPSGTIAQLTTRALPGGERVCQPHELRNVECFRAPLAVDARLVEGVCGARGG